MASQKPDQDENAQDNAGASAPKKGRPEHDAKGRITNTKLTKAEVAGMVHRMVPKRGKDGQIVKDKEGNPVSAPEEISVDDVMSFAEYDHKVVVVTKAGEKLEADK